MAFLYWGKTNGPRQKPLNIPLGYALLLLGFFLLAYILPLGVRDLVVQDETRYAEIPREMIASGDWVVPHLNGLRYFEKPVLGYWVHAGSQLLFGENNFAVRLPSALSVGLSALLIFLLVRRALRDADDKNGLTATLAALIFLSCFEVFVVGNTAVLDSLLAFFLTTAITAFYFASEEQPSSAREKRFLVLVGLSCGLAFLIKGFLAFAVPVLVLAPYLLWQQRYADLLRMAWLPILVAILVVLPWSIAIHLREPDFWHFFFWNEHIRRFMNTDAQHKESFWFFFLTAPAMFIPWTFLVPATVPAIKEKLFEQGTQSRLLKLCICWLVLPFLFFSLSHGKLLTYILPCFPPFAILMAFALLGLFKENVPNRLLQKGMIACGGLLVSILVAFLYVQSFGFKGAYPFSQPWKVFSIVGALIFFIVLLLWAFRTTRGQDKALIFGMAPVLLFFAVHFTIPDLTVRMKSPGPILEHHKRDVANGDRIISDENSVAAVCWYLRRNDVYILGPTGELDCGLSYTDGNSRSLNEQAAIDLIQRNPGKVVLFATAKNATQWQNHLPKPAFQNLNPASGYAFWRY